jgi:predicted N-acetyltransferase YhbS
MSARAAVSSSQVVVRGLREDEVDVADRVMRDAFGTFLGAPDPGAVMGDAEFVRTRFAAEPSWAFAAELDGELVGSNIATRWGCYGFFGPLSVRPDLWDQGIASALMQPVVELLEDWQVRQAGLFTFAHSVKHIGLYQKFGFWPQFLTAVMQKPIDGPPPECDPDTYAQCYEGERGGVLRECAVLTGAIFDGLDLAHEIRSVHAQELGDTVLVYDGEDLCGFAVCHLGAGEAGSGACYVKFAAARPGPDAADRFERLLDACEAIAGRRGLQQVIAGVNLARHYAYRRLLARGYRTRMQGVIMQRPNEPGYCREDVYAIDDLR